eukprot:11146127-Ditylum_brightwellii.AAC.1
MTDPSSDEQPTTSNASYTVIPQEYPMYVMHVSEFLKQEGKPRPHQELLADGKLKRIQEKDSSNNNDIATSPIIFLSHQWLGSSCPDADLRQIGVLQRVLRRMGEGDVPDVEIHYAHQLLYPGHGGELGKEEMKRL